MAQKQHHQFQNQKGQNHPADKPSAPAASSSQPKTEKKDASFINGWFLKLIPCILFLLDRKSVV